MINIRDERLQIMERANALGLWLNGRPARVSGCKLDFAQVHTIDNGTPLHGEWSWQAVRRIATTTRRFTL